VKYDKFLSQTPWIADKSLSAEENDLSRPEQLEKGKTQKSWNFATFAFFGRLFPVLYNYGIVTSYDNFLKKAAA